jgi:hypothetical protein
MEKPMKKFTRIMLATSLSLGSGVFAGDNGNATFTVTSSHDLTGVGPGELVEISIATDNWIDVQQVDVTLQVSSPDHFDVSIAAIVLGDDLPNENAFPPGSWRALGGLLEAGTEDRIRSGFAFLDPNPEALGHTGAADFKIRLLTSSTLTTDTEASVLIDRASLGPGAFDRDIVNVGTLIRINADPVTAVTEQPGGLPTSFELEQNYPNPFNPSTNIRFSLPHEAPVLVRVFDSLGRVQDTLVEEVLHAGNYVVDYHAAGLASGMYFYRIEAPGFTSTKKFTLLK